jgi:uncharacterized membrane protein
MAVRHEWDRQSLWRNIMTPQTAPTPLSVRFTIACIAFGVLGTLIFTAAASLISGGARISYADVPWALYIHVGTVIPALFLGAPVLLMKKGTAVHKLLGKFWAILMVTTSISSFWLQGLTGTIGPIHIFSVVTLISIPRGIYCARIGNMVAHQRAMTGPYIGLLVAGLFAFTPGRLFNTLALAAF